DAPGGTYSLTLSHVILLDARNAVIPTWAESGTFMVVSGGARLSIGQASGSPGSSDIIIPIDLYNAGSEVAAMQFDLNFDTDALQVTGVAKTDRTANMDIFSYSSTSNGIRMAATGIGHSVPPGTGPVANVTFEVSNNAAPGTYWMDLSGVVLADPLGNEIEVLAEGNWFTVTEETEVQLSQFSAECRLGKVFIEWTIGGCEDLIKFSLHRDVNQDGNYIKIHETDFRAEQKTYHFRDERIDREGLYTYELKVTNVSGRERVLGKTSVQVRDLFPQDFALEQNYPNPFNPATTIRYALPDVRRRRQDARQAPFFVSLKIYNILGQEARTLVNGHQEPGYYTVIWDGLDERGSAVPCGVYFYRLAVGSVDWSQTKRMVLLR
ncbi:MAG: cohesin domain-containing protein, partial [bacterium]